MPSLLRELLLPARPRELPGKRWLKIFLRGLHVLAAGLFVGASVFPATPQEHKMCLVAAVLTGVMLVSLDLYESGAFLLQVRGAVLVAKLACLCLLPWLGAARNPVLMVLVVVAVVSSHAPAKVRYHLLFGRGRVVASESRG